VLRKQRAVEIAIDRDRQDTPIQANNINTAESEELLQRLEVLRKRLADQQSIPPYIVFSNASLRLMAQQQPLTHNQFTQISGVGSRKLTQYGDTFLAEIRAFRMEKGLPLEHAEESFPALPAQEPRPYPSNTHLSTLELYQQGLKPFEIAEQRNLRLSTITSHLAELIEMGYDIPIDPLVSKERQEKIREAIQTVGGESRRRLRDHLGEVYGYDEIHLVQAWWRREQD
jgi:ATP-dependent DNA helicase RecQ